MSIVTEASRIISAKTGIKDAIRSQGIVVPTQTKMDSLAPYISAIGGANDLSLRDVNGNLTDAQNTANSYVVREVGTYMLPLVYGNGIKAGYANPQAYTRQGTTYTADFVNHLGNIITNPYIELNTGCTAASAGLLWQTTAGMITSVSLVNGVNCRYLQFNVGSVPATNGLAVLWVKDGNGDIMWSWAIWVTTDDLTTFKITNHTNVEYEMLGLPFGAIWNAGKDHYSLPYYQWCRKDAMAPAIAYNSASPTTLYDIEGNTYSGYGGYGANSDMDAGGTERSIKNSIKLPNKFFVTYGNGVWNNLSHFNNFWNAAETGNGAAADNQSTAIKTIYDPMPAGFMVPCGRFSTGFTASGGNETTKANFNIVGSSFSNGWTFKRNSEDTEGVYFPALGYINYSSFTYSNVGNYMRFATFASYSNSDALHLRCSSSAVSPLYNLYKTVGFTVWPTKELTAATYQELESIESDGNQWIDTGIVPSEDMKFEVDYLLTSLIGTTYSGNQTTDAAILAANISSANRYYALYFGSTNKYFYRGYFGSLQNYSQAVVDTRYKHEVIYKPGQQSIKLNGTSVYTGTATASSSYISAFDRTLFLFAVNGKNSTLGDYRVMAKLYSCKIWRNDILIADYVPVRRISDSVLGLYNKVNGAFLTNAGTGTFTAHEKQ